MLGIQIRPHEKHPPPRRGPAAKPLFEPRPSAVARLDFDGEHWFQLVDWSGCYRTNLASRFL